MIRVAERQEDWDGVFARGNDGELRTGLAGGSSQRSRRQDGAQYIRWMTMPPINYGPASL